MDTQSGGKTVKKFVFLFRGGFPDPKNQKDHMKEWEDWLAELNRSNRFVAGEPFDAPGKMVSSNGTADGEMNDDAVGGYMVVSAADQDEAVSLAKASPNIGLGGRVEVREALPMG
jgi:hypothetical protein